MVACVESGDLRDLQSPRIDNDKGTFTVQTSDAPFVRRRGARGQQKMNRKKVRLTPIAEHEEMEREESFSSSENETSMSPSSIELTDRNDTTLDNLKLYERSDTPVRKSCTPRLSLELDSFEEELENIPEETTGKTKDPEIVHILSDLPPRPKCKRKVLPPSITGPEAEKPKRNKLLKLRSKSQTKTHVDSVSHKTEYSVSKDLQRVIVNQSIRMITERMRPKSAENRIRVIRLSDLSSMNSSSVPDLPSIIQTITKQNELRYSPARTPQPSAVVRDNSFEDSGALSTPREGAATQASLRGSDLSSFYNMWDRDNKKRPFDRKDGEKGRGIHFNRSCLCSIRNCGKRCGAPHRNGVLPPIVSPHREV